MDQLTIGNALTEKLSGYLFAHPPALDEILGSVCEVYSVDPDEIEQFYALLAKRVYCYCAHRWAQVPNFDVGTRIGMSVIGVGKAAKHVSLRAQINPAMGADLDLVTLRIVERVLLRQRRERRAA
jgi:hypothetical protein